MLYLACVYVHRVSVAAAAAAAAALCVAILVLLIAAAVRHRVRAKIVAGSLNLIPVFSFSSFQRDLFLLYPLAMLSRLRPRFAYHFR